MVQEPVTVTKPQPALKGAEQQTASCGGCPRYAGELGPDRGHSDGLHPIPDADGRFPLAAGQVGGVSFSFHAFLLFHVYPLGNAVLRISSATGKLDTVWRRLQVACLPSASGLSTSRLQFAGFRRTPLGRGRRICLTGEIRKTYNRRSRFLKSA